MHPKLKYIKYTKYALAYIITKSHWLSAAGSTKVKQSINSKLYHTSDSKGVRASIQRACIWLGDCARSCFIAFTCTGEDWLILIIVVNM
jgi:hypothetical protein